MHHVVRNRDKKLCIQQAALMFFEVSFRSGEPLYCKSETDLMENPTNKGFSGSGAPIFGFGLADPAPKGKGVDPHLPNFCFTIISTKSA